MVRKCIPVDTICYSIEFTYLSILPYLQIDVSIEQQRELGKSIEPIFDQFISYIIPREDKQHQSGSTHEPLIHFDLLFASNLTHRSIDTLHNIVALLAGALYNIRKLRKVRRIVLLYSIPFNSILFVGSEINQ